MNRSDNFVQKDKQWDSGNAIFNINKLCRNVVYVVAVSSLLIGAGSMQMAVASDAVKGDSDYSIVDTMGGEIAEIEKSVSVFVGGEKIGKGWISIGDDVSGNGKNVVMASGEGWTVRIVTDNKGPWKIIAEGDGFPEGTISIPITVQYKKQGPSETFAGVVTITGPGEAKVVAAFGTGNDSVNHVSWGEAKICEPPVVPPVCGDPDFELPVDGDFDEDGILNGVDENPCDFDEPVEPPVILECGDEGFELHADGDYDGDGILNGLDENPCVDDGGKGGEGEPVDPVVPGLPDTGVNGVFGETVGMGSSMVGYNSAILPLAVVLVGVGLVRWRYVCVMARVEML